MTKSPYKLLDYYTYEDKDLFFGREEETRKMVGEILSTRLLVLFSPSGSGKTSLINAGVRPQLDDMGYKAIYTRLEDEPIPSVCHAVSQALDLPPCEEKEDLYEFVKKAAQTAGQPLVIFLDQFEEFFIVFDKEKRQPFIEQTARIKYDDQLPVFLVLSLREDYFGSLHEFRESIPSIFQNNANLRLKPFTERQARRAIEEPLKNKDIEGGEWRFEEGLIDTIVHDLKTGKGIEPIKLQLVCGALWDKRPGGDSIQIPLSIYSNCGRADKILSTFTFDRLKEVPRGQHKLMVRLFESLKTPDNTKRFRSFEDLQTQLKIKKPDRLKPLLHLLSNRGILRRESQGGTNWYEYKHDYIVDEINGWIRERKKRLNRHRFLYAILPGIILFLSLFSYFFIEYHTFYATFTQPQYKHHEEEIVIVRGFKPFDDRITTGLFMSAVKDQEAKNALTSQFKISFGNKNDWSNLADTLSMVERGKFLFRIGQTKAGIETLRKALKDSDYDVRRQAAKALGRLGNADNTVIQELINALKKNIEDPFGFAQRQAAEALVRLGTADSTVIQELRNALKDKDSFVRHLATAILVRLGNADKTVIQELTNALKDKDSYVRRQAAKALGRLGNADNTVIQELINALKDKNPFVRRQAAYALGRLGNADNTVIQELRNALKDSDSYVRRQAAEALGRLGNADNTVIQELINALKDKDDPLGFVRRQAAEALVRLGTADNTVIQEIINALKDEDYAVRRQAAEALVRLGTADNTVIQELINALKDSNYAVRRQAAEALGRLGTADNTVIQELINALKDSSSYVRLQAAEALVRLGTADKTVIQEIINALKDENPFVRAQAAEALGTLYKDKSETELMELLQRPDSGYRTTAAHALAQQKTISPGIQEQITHLKDHDERPWVRLAAWDAFELIQPRLESEKRAKQYTDEGDKTFSNGEFWRANLLYENAFDSIEKYTDVNHEKAAHIKFQQARCTAKLNRLVDTLEYLEDAFKYNPALKERVKNELAKDDSEWTLIKDNWYWKEVLLRGK